MLHIFTDPLLGSLTGLFLFAVVALLAKYAGNQAGSYLKRRYRNKENL